MLCIWRFWVRWYNFSKQVIYQVKYSKSLLIVLKLLNIFMDIKNYNWYDFFNRSPNFPSKFNLNQAYIDQYIGLCCSLFSIFSPSGYIVNILCRAAGTYFNMVRTNLIEMHPPPCTVCWNRVLRGYFLRIKSELIFTKF